MSSGGLLSAHGSLWALRRLRGSGVARDRNPGPEESSQGPSTPKELRRPLLRRDSSANALPAPQGQTFGRGAAKAWTWRAPGFSLPAPG